MLVIFIIIYLLGFFADRAKVGNVEEKEVR